MQFVKLHWNFAFDSFAEIYSDGSKSETKISGNLETFISLELKFDKKSNSYSGKINEIKFGNFTINIINVRTLDNVIDDFLTREIKEAGFRQIKLPLVTTLNSFLNCELVQHGLSCKCALSVSKSN